MTDKPLSIPIDSIEKDFQDFIQPDLNEQDKDMINKMLGSFHYIYTIKVNE